MKSAVKKNKRNITGGEIHLNQIDLNDKVDDDAAQDYEDNLIKVLDLQPETTKIFIENLQNGTFIQISESSLRKKIQMMQDSQQKQIQTENVLLVLNNLIHGIIKLVDRFVFFFQGLLAGMCIMHLVIIFLNDDVNTFLDQYKKYALRIDQVFHIILLISCFGSMFVAHQLSLQSEKTRTALDKKFYIQSVVSAVCIFFDQLVYALSYILWVINHQAMAQLSVNNLDSTGSRFSLWRYCQIIITIFTLIGWYISVNTTESNLDFLASVAADEIVVDEKN